MANRHCIWQVSQFNHLSDRPGENKRANSWKFTNCNCLIVFLIALVHVHRVITELESETHLLAKGGRRSFRFPVN